MGISATTARQWFSARDRCSFFGKGYLGWERCGIAGVIPSESKQSKKPTSDKCAWSCSWSRLGYRKY